VIRILGNLDLFLNMVSAKRNRYNRPRYLIRSVVSMGNGKIFPSDNNPKKFIRRLNMMCATK
jgi:hypothetical protein